MTLQDPVVLILGSGPNAICAKDWARTRFDRIVVINNAHRLRADWDYAIFPEDFPAFKHPHPTGAQTLVTANDYVPAQNRLGGFVYAGGTMAFTAGYWALDALRPRVMAFMGCDMVYPTTGNTHFYGAGTADPLRKDITLQSLEAKSARLALSAAARGCACVNLSHDSSRLLFSRADPGQLDMAMPIQPDPTSLAAALDRETALGYMVPSGRYWEVEDQFDAAALWDLDDLWLAAFDAAISADTPANPALHQIVA